MNTNVLQADANTINAVTGKIIIDFYADWCGPCQMLGPVFEEVAAEVSNLNFFKLNIDKHKELAEKYNVQSIPCLIILEHGTEIARSLGFINKKKMLQFIKDHE